MRKIFPTFNEIQQGLCVYDKQGRYKGLDYYDNPVFSRRLSQTVSVMNGYYSEYVAIDIVLNRKYERVGFQYGYDDKRRSRQYEYSQNGYSKMLKDIKKDLEYNAEQIKKLIKDLEESEETE